MTDKPKFWMVWSPRGKPPRQRHYYRDAAEREAKRLSLMLPGRHFYVLEMIGFSIEGPELPSKKQQKHDADPARMARAMSGGPMPENDQMPATPTEQQAVDELNRQNAEKAGASATEQPTADAGTSSDQGDGATQEPKTEAPVGAE